MSTRKPDDDAGDSGRSEAAKKKPYVKPAFRHERVFETMALACGKVSTTDSTCRVNRRNS